MHCKNLYELSLAGKMMCYGSLSEMSPFFTIEDICIGLKKLASRKAKRSSMSKGLNAQMGGKGSTCMDKQYV
jgi:hypothetical protein